MSTEAYGRSAVYLVMVTIFVPIVGLSVHGLVSVQYFSPKRDELPSMIASMLMLNIFLLGLTYSTLIFSSFFISAIGGISLSWIGLAAAAAVLQSAVMISLALLQAKEEPVRFGIVQVSTSVTVGLISVLLLYANAGEWHWRAIAHFIGYFTISTSAMLYIRSNGWMEFNFPAIKLHWQKCVKFGLPLLPHALGAMAIATAGQLMIAENFGPKEVAYYALALQISSALGLVADAFVKTYTPWLFKQLNNGTKQAFRKITRTICASFLFFPILSLAFWFFISNSLTWIVGDNFSDTIPLLKYFCAAGACTGMYYSIANLYFYSNQNGKLASITMTAGIIGLIAMKTLGKTFGLEGFALGYLIGQATLFLLVFGFSFKFHPLPWNSIFREKSLNNSL